MAREGEGMDLSWVGDIFKVRTRVAVGLSAASGVVLFLFLNRKTAEPLLVGNEFRWAVWVCVAFTCIALVSLAADGIKWIMEGRKKKNESSRLHVEADNERLERLVRDLGQQLRQHNEAASGTTWIVDRAIHVFIGTDGNNSVEVTPDGGLVSFVLHFVNVAPFAVRVTKVSGRLFAGILGQQVLLAEKFEKTISNVTLGPGETKAFEVSHGPLALKEPVALASWAQLTSTDYRQAPGVIMFTCTATAIAEDKWGRREKEKKPVSLTTWAHAQDNRLQRVASGRL
jgi:hypothetical protein